MNTQEILDEIIKARQISGMSQKELGEKICLEQSDISKIENGKRKPYMKDIVAMCVALGLELSVSKRKANP